MNDLKLVEQLEKALSEATKRSEELQTELNKYTSVSPTLELNQAVWGQQHLTVRKPDRLYAITVPAVSSTPVYLRSAIKTFIYEYITVDEPKAFVFWLIAQSDTDYSPVYETAFCINGIPSDVYRKMETIWQEDLEMFDNMQTIIVQCISDGRSGLEYRPIEVFRTDAAATAPIDWSSHKHISRGCSYPSTMPFLCESVYRFENPSFTFLVTTDTTSRHLYQYTVDRFPSEVTTTTENFISDYDWWW